MKTLFSLWTMLCLSAASWAGDPALLKSGVADAKVSVAELAQEIKANRYKVPEFKFIADEALKLGISDVWLFGGSAASLGQYEKQNILSRQGKYDGVLNSSALRYLQKFPIAFEISFVLFRQQY